jgi:hypothetical protein
VEIQILPILPTLPVVLSMQRHWLMPLRRQKNLTLLVCPWTQQKAANWEVVASPVLVQSLPT